MSWSVKGGRTRTTYCRTPAGSACRCDRRGVRSRQWLSCDCPTTWLGSSKRSDPLVDAARVRTIKEGRVAKGVFRFFNRVHILLYRLTRGRVGGRILGIRGLLLTTKGRKSGKERTVPLGTFEDRGRYVVVASNGGPDVHPAWFFKLRNDPRVRIPGGAAGPGAGGRRPGG